MLDDKSIEAIGEYKKLQGEFKKGIDILLQNKNLTLPDYMILELFAILDRRLTGIEGTIFKIADNMHTHTVIKDSTN